MSGIARAVVRANRVTSSIVTSASSSDSSRVATSIAPRDTGMRVSTSSLHCSRAAAASATCSAITAIWALMASRRARMAAFESAVAAAGLRAPTVSVPVWVVSVIRGPSCPCRPST